MISIISWSIVTPLILALTAFSLEVLLGLRPQKPVAIKGGLPHTVVLMPAHNEASLIGNTLEQLIAVLHENTNILVVADNCTDNTAEIAREKGVEVIERNSIHEKGKGYALSFGRDHIRHSPPECVIVLDADCEIDRRSLLSLSIYCVDKELPIQAQNILRADGIARPMVQISNFAFWVKNVVRQRGSARMGGSALLNGTGMAFPWRIFENLPLATSNVVEDLGLGIHLTQIGFGPVYFDQAHVISAAASEQATIAQRSRWELGFMSMAKQFGVCTLWLGLRTLNLSTFLLGLNLLVPPLAMLFSVSIATMILLGIFTLIIGFTSAFVALAVTLFIATLSIFLAWIYGGKNWLKIGGLMRLPIYLIWKLPIFLRLLQRKKPNWNRTQRELPQAEINTDA